MNQLKVNQQQTILTLSRQGWSKRRIAVELGLDRATVRKYAGSSKPATNPNPGSDSKSPTPVTGSERPPDSKPATNPITGAAGPESSCQPWTLRIQQAWSSGLSIQRIFQDLISEEGFEGSYSAVRRFVRHLPDGAPELPFRRMECAPGQELRTASLTIANDDSDKGVYDFAIQGTGTPKLTAMQTVGSIEIVWPEADSAGYVLQESPALGALANWTDSATPFTIVDGMKKVILMGQLTDRYYRLILRP